MSNSSDQFQDQFPEAPPAAASQPEMESQPLETSSAQTEPSFVESSNVAHADLSAESGADDFVDEAEQDFDEVDDTEVFEIDEPVVSVSPPAPSENRSKRPRAELHDADSFDDDFDNDPAPGQAVRSRETSSAATFAPQRLAKILAAAGIDARRKCEELVTAGRVTVDGEVVTDLAFRADPFSQTIELDGERLKLQRKVYFVLNKPRGVVCTNFDPSGRPRVIDLFPQFKERLFTIGRLDEESEGLLLVTNDGELANRLAHPRYRVPKFYLCHVKGVPSAETLASLKRGLYFEEGRFAVEGVRMKKVVGASSYLDIVLNEGQNREIRRLMARVDHKVMRLKRVGFGPIRLGDLPSGAFRQLNTAEHRLLTDLSEQRAYLDNTASRGRKKKFGERANFGGRPKFRSDSPSSERSRFGRPQSDEYLADDRPPRGERTQTRQSRSDRPRDSARSTGQSRVGQRRYVSQSRDSDQRNQSALASHQNDNRRDNLPAENVTRDDRRGEFGQRTYRTGARPPRGRNDSGPLNSRGPRQYRSGGARLGQRGQQPGSYDSSERPRGNRRSATQDENNEQGAYRSARPPRDGNRFGGNRGIQRRFPANDVADDFVIETGDTDFGGGRRRFVSEESGEQTFPSRPQRGSRRDDQGRSPRREYGQNGPRRDNQSRRPPRPEYRQGRPPQYGNNEPRGNRPSRPMTADGKEILEGRVTGYRSQTKEGPARRRLKAVQGMQLNRQKRQQRRKETDN